MARNRRLQSRLNSLAQRRQAKHRRFPKGSLADWQTHFEPVNAALQEAIAADAAIQAECMPLRKRYVEIEARQQQLLRKHGREKYAFGGIFAWLYSPPAAEAAELERLTQERGLLKSQISALAGLERRKKPWGNFWREEGKLIYEISQLNLPLETPFTRRIFELQTETELMLWAKPSPQEDAALKQYEAELEQRAERKVQREATKAEREVAKKRKAEADEAAVAAALEKTRKHADRVKRSLPQNHGCPYCGGELGPSPHADHVYPVSKGGRSVNANMVYVCASCNVRKGDMTLAAFIATWRLDRDTIESRLQRLGKEY